LRPCHLTALIPEVADLIRELFDFDFLSTENTRIVFRALMQEFRKPGVQAYYAFYYLKAILYDRSENFKTSVQNLIIEVLGADFGRLISKLKAISESHIESNESARVPVNDSASDSGDSEAQEETAQDLKAPSEELPRTVESPIQTLGEGDYCYIAYCLMLLGHCSVDNEIVRTHIRTLDLLSSMADIFTANKQRHGLVSSVLQVINAAYPGSALSQEEAQCLATGLGAVLDITEEVLQREAEMVNVIFSNLYAMAPMRGMVPLSSKSSHMQSGQSEALKLLQFLLNGSPRDIPSGIVVSLPAALMLLEHSGTDNSHLKQRFLKLLPRIAALFEKASDDEGTFDLSLCRAKLQAARMEDPLAAVLVASSFQSLSQLKNMGNLLTSRPSFTSQLAQVYTALRKNNSMFLDIENSMGFRFLAMIKGEKFTRACKCLKKLMNRVRNFSFFVTAGGFTNFLWNNSLRSIELKTFIESGMMLDSFMKLFEDKRMKSDVAILYFINSVLENQPADLVIAVKDQLVQQLLDKELLSTIVRELNNSIKVIIATKDASLPVSSYMPLLSRFDYKTFGEDSRRVELIGYIGVLVRSYLLLLQRFCDNCNLPMQNYMRTQGGTEDVNLVKLVMDYLCTISSLENGNLAESQLQLSANESLKALIEFATGPCIDNQTLIGRYVPLYIAFNKLFDTPPDSYYAWQEGCAEAWEDKYTQLRATGVKLLQVLLEGSPNTEVVKCMDKFLLKDLLLDNIKRVYCIYVKRHRTQVTTEDPCVKAILPLVKNALEEACFLITLLSKNESQKLQEVTRDVEDLEAFKEFYTAYIGYVEIDMPSQDSTAQLRDIYFVIPFKCKFLPYETAKSLILDANHDTHQDLVEGLLKAAKSCKAEMEYHQVISRSPKHEYMLSQWRHFKIASLVVVFAINFTLLVASDQDYYEALVWDSWTSFIAVLLFGVIQVVLYVAGTALYVLDAFPKISAEAVDEGISMEELGVQPDRDSQMQRYRESLKAEETNESEVIVWPKVLTDIKLDIAYVLLSLLAIYLPVFYPLLLFQIFAHIADLRTVLQAITQNKVQLLYTAIFGLIVLFCVTSICFVNYSSTFDIKENNMSCEGLLECYLSVINQGFRSGGGLGDALGAPAKEDRTQFWTRMVFDFCFFIVISVILLQIIFGIILDAFGDMRDKRGDLLEDINSKCFICGTPRSDLELYGKGWKYHFQSEHSPYAYLSFLVYLLDKDVADCSGVEKWAKEKLGKVDTTFLPCTSKLLAQRKLS